MIPDYQSNEVQSNAEYCKTGNDCVILIIAF